jgi:DNA replication protein DnaC
MDRLRLTEPLPIALDESFGRRAVRTRLQMDLGRRYYADRVSLASFEVYHPSQADVLKRLKAILGQWPGRLLDGHGLIFYGPVGTGKDHLMAAMLHVATAMHGLECRWYNGQEIYGQFRDCITRRETEAELLGRLAVPQVLGISDAIPPAGEASAWNLNMLYRLIDRRYGDMKSTWVSLNAKSEEEADEQLTGPVWDRLQEYAEIFRCYWPSYRELVRNRPAAP